MRKERQKNLLKKRHLIRLGYPVPSFLNDDGKDHLAFWTKGDFLVVLVSLFSLILFVVPGYERTKNRRSRAQQRYQHVIIFVSG
jgi:hypothetical protein